MECTLSGNGIKGFHRGVVCLSRVGPELLIEALPDKVILRSLNAARSAFVAVTFKRQYFDRFQLASPTAQCSVLLKAACTVLRTQPGSIERLNITLPSGEATKLQFTLECFNGLRKTYWITCNHDVEMQHVAIDKSQFQSYLVARPRDFSRLLSNFQSSLQEITLIATEPAYFAAPGTTPERKAVELRSYIDPVKESSDGSLHTQLWIDPAEELRDYRHRGSPVDVTFSVKELKAFMAFCEGSDADMHLFFERAGSPILLAPKFTIDEATNADFDATLVLATMLGSQLRSSDTATQVPPVPGKPAEEQNRTSASPHTPAAARASAATSAVPRSDHTVVWSELSASAGGEQTNFRDRAAGLRTLNLQDSEGTEEVLPGETGADGAGRPTVHVTMDQQDDAPDVTMQQEQEPEELQEQELQKQHEQEQELQKQHEQEQELQKKQEQQQRRELMNWIGDEEEEETDAEDDGLCIKSTPPHERGRIFP